VTISAARVWPATDYTRVAFESATDIQHTVFSLENPERLVLDLENVELSPALTGLIDKVGDSDPYIKSVRVGRFKPGTIRLVFDLKASVKPRFSP
jgi:N-acetylmuramoyl-L-alanine amidase